MNYSILLASAFISAAILWNGHLDRQQGTRGEDRPSLKDIADSARLSFEAAFSDGSPPLVLGKPRKLKEVLIEKVRFNPDNQKAKVDFLLNFQDGEGARSSYILFRDDFGDYSGSWRDREEKVAFFVKAPEQPL